MNDQTDSPNTQVKKALLIMNPKSRQGSEVKLDEGVERLEQAGIRVEQLVSTGPEESRQAVRQRKVDLDLVIMGGGDGTISSIAGTLYECNLLLAILPLGTANDLARSLGLSGELDEAFDLIISGTRKHIDLGLAMSILRNDTQVALNNLHVALMKSADHYRSAAEFLSDQPVSQLFESLANERDRLAKEAEEAIRESHDLPTIPDADRETVEQLVQRLKASFAADEVSDVLAQRLKFEAQLEQELNATDMVELDKSHPKLRGKCLKSIVKAQKQLEEAEAG